MDGQFHYHVYAGTVGPLPDGDPAVYSDHASALAALESEVADYRDAGIECDGNSIDGYTIAPVNYLEVRGCRDPQCIQY